MALSALTPGPLFFLPSLMLLLMIT
jgi:hypothetical protein